MCCKLKIQGVFCEHASVWQGEVHPICVHLSILGHRDNQCIDAVLTHWSHVKWPDLSHWNISTFLTTRNLSPKLSRVGAGRLHGGTLLCTPLYTVSCAWTDYLALRCHLIYGWSHRCVLGNLGSLSHGLSGWTAPPPPLSHINPHKIPHTQLLMLSWRIKRSTSTNYTPVWPTISSKWVGMRSSSATVYFLPFIMAICMVSSDSLHIISIL